jgi:hypothetical protein
MGLTVGSAGGAAGAARDQGRKRGLKPVRARLKIAVPDGGAAAATSTDLAAILKGADSTVVGAPLVGSHGNRGASHG